jgi:hypothetical protein
MTNANERPPVVLYYTEGSETYAVDAAGHIARPAIGMAASGGWRLTGIANRYGHRAADFPGMIQALLDGTSYPLAGSGARHLTDWDHGTHRMHGHAVKRVWLAADHGLTGPELLALVDRLDRARRDAEAAREAAANDARKAAAEAQGRVLYYGPATCPVFSVYRFKRRPEGFTGDGPAFALVYRSGGASEPLEYGAACRAIGAAMLEEAGA